MVGGSVGDECLKEYIVAGNSEENHDELVTVVGILVERPDSRLLNLL
jgi:hypothetical protein